MRVRARASRRSRLGCSSATASSLLRTARSRSTPRSGSHRSRSGSRRRSRRCCLDLDESGAQAWLSHTAGFRPESAEPLPEACQGLWSYSNAGFWAAGEACAAATGLSFSAAMRERILEPLGLEHTGFEEPADAAPGHVQEGETGHAAAGSAEYPVARRPSGGLWSTVGDLLLFARHQFGGPGPLSRRPARVAAGAAGRGARRSLLPRLLEARARGRPDRLRPRGIRRRLSVAAAARPGGTTRRSPSSRTAGAVAA